MTRYRITSMVKIPVVTIVEADDRESAKAQAQQRFEAVAVSSRGVGYCAVPDEVLDGDAWMTPLGVQTLPPEETSDG